MSYVHKKLTAKEERLWGAFQKLDLDGDGRVTAAEVEQVLANTLGPQDSKELARVCIAQVMRGAQSIDVLM